MIRYECDKCGLAMAVNDPRRYIVRLEIYAAAGHVDLDIEDAVEPGRGMDEVVKELVEADPDEVEDQTYRLLRFDVCDTCRRELLGQPLGDTTCAGPSPGGPAA